MAGHLHRPLFRSALTHEVSSVAAEAKRRLGLQLRERGERSAGVPVRNTPGSAHAPFRPRPGERSA